MYIYIIYIYNIYIYIEWGGPIILKGILDEQDAETAAKIADLLVVSNHGGRQLDSARSTIEALLGVVYIYIYIYICTYIYM